MVMFNRSRNRYHGWNKPARSLRPGRFRLDFKNYYFEIKVKERQTETPTKKPHLPAGSLIIYLKPTNKN